MQTMKLLTKMKKMMNKAKSYDLALLFNGGEAV
jgi:hypothetical protein